MIPTVVFHGIIVVSLTCAFSAFVIQIPKNKIQIQILVLEFGNCILEF